MPAAKQQIRQIIADNNLNNVADVYSLLRDSFKDIHCLITEGGFSDDGFWRVVKHFSYPLLRKSFQTALLNEMEKKIGPSFRNTKASIYKKDKNGFYVYAKPNLCDTAVRRSDRLVTFS